MNLDAYNAFLADKVKVAEHAGFDVADDEIHPMLLPHQRAAVRWACAGGRRALFEKFAPTAYTSSKARPGPRS